MTPEDESYYETYFDLFNSDGWDQLIKQVQQDREDFKIESIKDERHLFQMQGQIFILDTLINMEDTIRSTYDGLLVQESLHEHDT